MLLTLAASLALLRFLPRLPWGRRLVLEPALPAGAGGAAAPQRDYFRLGKHGITASPLRPAGLAHIDGERVNVVSDGAFIEAGEPVEVIRVDGNRFVVRRPRTTDAKE